MLGGKRARPRLEMHSRAVEEHDGPGQVEERSCYIVGVVIKHRPQSNLGTPHTNKAHADLLPSRVVGRDMLGAQVLCKGTNRFDKGAGAWKRVEVCTGGQRCVGASERAGDFILPARLLSCQKEASRK